MAKLLYVGASPSDLDRAGVEVLGTLIREAFEGTDFTVEVESACTWRDFKNHLLEHQPDYLHLGFHGEAGDLFFLDPDHKKQRIPGDRVAKEVAAHPSVHWVVLNACQSVGLAEALAAVVQEAVGIDGDISHGAAHAYTEGFYMALRYGRTFAEAHAYGCRSIGDWCEEKACDDESLLPKRFGRVASAARPSAPLAARPGAASAAGLGRELTAGELEQVVQLAMKLGFLDDATRDLLLADLPIGFVASLKDVPERDLQLRHDLWQLNDREALEGLTGRPLAAWLLAAYHLAHGRSRPEGAELAQWLVLAGGTPPQAPGPLAPPPTTHPQTTRSAPLPTAALTAGPVPPPSDALERLRRLLRQTLVQHPGLRGALAARLGAPDDAANLADALLDRPMEAIIKPLVALARGSTSHREAAQRVAALALPASRDWAALRAQVTLDALIQIHAPVVTAPLCEIAMAAVQGRAAQLKEREERRSGVPAPAYRLVPHLEQVGPVHMYVARAILTRTSGIKREDLPDDAETLLQRANEAIRHCREEYAEDEAFQMYLVFKDADDEALKALRWSLPELWRVRGDKGDGPSLLMHLTELYQWET